MKLKEASLNINVKKMALKKKRDRIYKQGRTAAAASTSEVIVTHREKVLNISNNLSTQIDPDHVDYEQRLAWGKDLVDIATRGRIEKGSSLHWTFNKGSHLLNKGKRVGSWDIWWKTWKRDHGLDVGAGEMGNNDFSFFDGGTRMA